MIPQFTQKIAIFDDTRTWRYSLGRSWDHGDGALAVIGLNPSTADESVEDPTVRRCIDWAETWGFQRLIMLNIFAYRSTDPRALRQVKDPVGPLNDTSLLVLSQSAALVIAAWGNHGRILDRHSAVMRLLRDVPLFCLGETKEYFPKHPLYLRKATVPREYNDAARVAMARGEVTIANP